MGIRAFLPGAFRPRVPAGVRLVFFSVIKECKKPLAFLAACPSAVIGCRGISRALGRLPGDPFAALAALFLGSSAVGTTQTAASGSLLPPSESAMPLLLSA